MKELNEQDRERIEQEAHVYQVRLDSNEPRDFLEKAYIDGAEYATIYEREQQPQKIKELEKWKEDATSLNSRTATKRVELEQKIKQLEAERSELKNKLETFLQDKIKESFLCLERGIWENPPFDDCDRPQIEGMKRAYGDTLTFLNSLKTK